MSPELGALAGSVAVHLAAVAWSQRSLDRDVGREGNVSARDDIEGRLSVRTKRLRRALANHTENFAPFLVGVLLVELTGANSAFTALAAWIHVALRALYLPAYAFAWVPWRSAIYFGGLLATLALIGAALFGGGR